MRTSNLFGLIIMIVLAFGMVINGITYHTELDAKKSQYKQVDALITMVNSERDGMSVRRTRRTYYILPYYHVYLHYVVDGKEYKEFSPGAFRVRPMEGDTVTIYCNPENPRDMISLTSYRKEVGFYIAAAVFAVIAYVQFLSGWIHRFDGSNVRDGYFFMSIALFFLLGVVALFFLLPSAPIFETVFAIVIAIGVVFVRVSLKSFRDKY